MRHIVAEILRVQKGELHVVQGEQLPADLQVVVKVAIGGVALSNEDH